MCLLPERRVPARGGIDLAAIRPLARAPVGQRLTWAEISASFASIICLAAIIAPANAPAEDSNSAVGNCCHDSSQAALAATEKLDVKRFAGS